MHDETMVTVSTCHGPEEARVVAAVLEANGIPTFIDGQSLQDEFAMSQRLMNLSIIEVQVPASRQEEAQGLLAAAKRVGEAWSEEEGEGSEGDGE